MIWHGGRAGVLVSRAGRVLGVLGLLVFWALVWPGLAWAQPVDAGAVAGSYTVDDPTPTPGLDAPPGVTCWSLRSGDVITVDATAADRLQVTIPSGRSWRLQPMTDLSDSSLGYASKWIGVDDDLASKGQGSILEYYTNPRYIRAKLGYGYSGLGLTTTACEIHLSAFPIDGAPGDPAPPAGQQLGVSLACQHDFGDSGRVECTATPTQPADAYDWTFDGSPQAATGPELLMSGVATGSHTVSVVARDTVNGLTSPPDSLTLTTEAGGDGGGVPVLPLALGAGALLGGAVLAARKLRRPAISGVSVPDGVLGAPMAPRLPPESLRGPYIPSWPQGPPADAAPQPAGLPAKPRRPPEALRGGTAPPGAKPATPRPASRPVRQAVPPATTPPKQQQSRRNFWIEVRDTGYLHSPPGTGSSSIRLRGNGRHEETLYVRAFRRVDGVVTDVSGEVKVGSVKLSDEKKIHRREIPGSPNFAVHGTHVGTVEFLGSVSVAATSARGESAHASVAVIVVPATWELHVRAEKAGFDSGYVTLNLPHACVQVKGSVMSHQFAGLSAFTQHVSDAPVAHARCTAKMGVDGPWRSLGEVHTGPDGSFSIAIPRDVLSQFDFAVDVNEHVLSPIKLPADREVRDAVRGYDDALQGFIGGLGKQAPAKYFEVTERCMEYPAQFLEQLRTREEPKDDRWLGAIHLLRASITFQRSHRRDFKQQREMLSMAGKDFFSAVFDVFTDFVPVASWMLGEPLAFPLVSKVLARLGLRDLSAPPLELMSLPAFVMWIVDKIGQTRAGRWFVVNPLEFLFKGIRVVLEGLVKLLVEFFKLLLEWAKPFGDKVDALRRFVDAIDDDLARGSDAWGGGLEGLVISLGEMFVAIVQRLILGSVWAFLTVAAWTSKALSAVIAGTLGQFGYDGAKATWGEQFEEWLGDFAKKAYDGVGQFIEACLSGPRQAASAPQRDLNDVVMDAVAPMDDMDARCVSALSFAHDSSLMLDVPKDWPGRLKLSIRQESEMQHMWQQWYTQDDGSYGFVQYAEFAERCAKFAVRLAQMACFSASVVQAGMAKLLKAKADEVVTSDAAAAAALLQSSETHAKKGRFATDLAGMFETLVDIVCAVFVRAKIFGLELKHLFCILELSQERVKGLYKQ